MTWNMQTNTCHSWLWLVVDSFCSIYGDSDVFSGVTTTESQQGDIWEEDRAIFGVRSAFWECPLPHHIPLTLVAAQSWILASGFLAAEEEKPQGGQLGSSQGRH